MVEEKVVPKTTTREQVISEGLAAVGKYMSDYLTRHGTLPDDPWGGLSIITGPDGEEIDLEFEMEVSRFGLGPAMG